MQCIYIPGEDEIMLVQNIVKIMKDQKNESKLRRLGKAMSLYILSKFLRAYARSICRNRLRLSAFGG
jgi:hypothetical protein